MSQFAEIAEYGPKGKIHHRESLLGNVYIVELESSRLFFRPDKLHVAPFEGKDKIKSLPCTLKF